MTAFEYQGRLQGGKSRPHFVAAYDAARVSNMVLKLRDPGTRTGHYFGTSMAIELICSMLARGLGLPVPDFAIVDVSADFADTVTDPRIQTLLRANVGPNFGCVYHEAYPTWDPNYQATALSLVQALEDTLAFDALTFNGDRKAVNPNLLARAEKLLLIDHSLALPVHLWSNEVLNASPPFPDRQIREHCTYLALRGKGLPFDRLFAAWTAEVHPGDLRHIRSLIPPAWEYQTGDLDKVFRFLQHRPARFADLRLALRGIVA